MAGRTYAVILDSSGALVDIDDLPDQVAEAARRAVNKAADRARAWSAEEVRKQVMFPARYVSKSEGRLAVTARASKSNLVARVSARQRPTSLARFAMNRPRKGQKGVRVQVKPGYARYMRGAFFIKLRQGGDHTDTAFNLGLAVRTKNGVRPNKAWKPVQMRNGLWLLYGPSVSQALLSARGSGIWPKMEDKIKEYLGDEFNRQMDLLNG